MTAGDTRTEPVIDIAPETPARPASPPPSLIMPQVANAPVQTAPAPVMPAAAPRGMARPGLRLLVKRNIRSGLIGGKKFEIVARVDSERDLNALFKGYPDELLMAYKSGFVDKSFALRRSELARGVKFSVGSLNEMIELEDRLAMGFDQLRRMVAIIDAGDAEIALET